MSCCSDVMDPIEVSACCTPQDIGADAARAIRDSGCGCSPVVEDRTNLKLLGVVTELDVCCDVAANNRGASCRERPTRLRHARFRVAQPHVGTSSTGLRVGARQ